MSDYELCHHGREIACLECIAEAKAEAAVQPPATPQEPTPLTLQACVECGDPIGWDASPDPTCCLCGDARRREAERTVASLACMLGWDNVPPREVLERSVNALKARVSTPSPEGQTWQPIETAPKDGTRMLAWSATGGVMVVYWDRYYAPGGRGFEQRQTAWVGPDGDALWAGDAPTVWMPLPSPPTPEGTQP